MSTEYLEDLERDVIQAVRTLEGERYYEFSWSLMEIIRQAKHYQRIAESLLAGHTGLKLEANQAEFNRAHSECDWFRYPEKTESRQRPAAEIE
jgi:hypothetical protein